MHLLGHAHGNSDILITDNTKDFLADGRQKKLNNAFQIVVMKPLELVKTLSRKHGW